MVLFIILWYIILLLHSIITHLFVFTTDVQRRCRARQVISVMQDQVRRPERGQGRNHHCVQEAQESETGDS